jgi:hypothetical protein
MGYGYLILIELERRPLTLSDFLAGFYFAPKRPFKKQLALNPTR